MRLLYIALLGFHLLPCQWFLNFADAQMESAKTHKRILVSFSGSDWCGPCIREKKEIFDSEAFERFAASNLVLVKADFPRQKKNLLSAEQTRLNELLADKYNPEGKFPYTVLIDEEAKVLMVWEGLPVGGAEKFIQQIGVLQNNQN